MKKFDWKKTVYKVVGVLVPLLAMYGVNLDIPATFEGFSEDAAFITIMTLAGILKAVQNIRKNWKVGKKVGRNFPLIIFCLMMPVALLACSTNGSVSTRFAETIFDENGQPQTTSYEAESKAGIFGEVNESLHEFSYAYDNNLISVGQNQAGISNAGQIEALKISADMVNNILPSIIQGFLQYFLTPRPGSIGVDIGNESYGLNWNQPSAFPGSTP